MDIKLTAEIKKRGIPPLYSQENSDDPTVYLVIHLGSVPYWCWYVTECEFEDDVDVLFFGFVKGLEKEWGYFRYSDFVETYKPILVDYEFQPMPFSEVKKEYQL
jgi:hypothetical protein